MKKKNIRNIIKEIIDKHDPIGLLKIGCPDDEYSIEVEDISKNIRKCTNSKQIQSLVHRTFVKWFGRDIAGKRKGYKKISQDIYQMLLKPTRSSLKTAPHQ